MGDDSVSTPAFIQDRFLRPDDGKLVPLFVQNFDEDHLPRSQRAWTRIGKPQPQLPLFVKLANWIWSPALQTGSQGRGHDAYAIFLVVARWLISLPLLLLLLAIFQVPVRTLKAHRFNASYDPVFIKPEDESASPSSTEGDGQIAEDTDLLHALQHPKSSDDRILRLSGIPAATIDWASLDPVLTWTLTGRRALWLAVLLTVTPVLILGALYMLFLARFLRTEHSPRPFCILFCAGAVMLCLSALVSLGATWLTHIPRGGRIHDLHPRLLGFEGEVDTRTIKRHLFGSSRGRLVEAHASSREPYRDDPAQSSSSSTPTQERLSGQTDGDLQFTLIDTYTMTVYRIAAERPPVAAFMCGTDHDGAKMAVLCSYDRHTNTFFREATIYAKGMAFERMKHAEGFRLSLQRLSRGQTHSRGQEQPGTEQDSSEVWSFMSRVKKVDLILLPLMWFIYGLQPLHFAESRRYTTLSYYTAFLLVQVPACFLLRRTNMGQALFIPIWLKGAMSLFTITSSGHSSSTGILIASQGVVDGIIFPAFVILTCSWYTPRELPIRMLIWTSSRQVLCLIPSWFWEYRPIHLVYTLIWSLLSMGCVLAATYAFHHLGTPLHVRWLPTHERMELAASSTAKMDSPLGAPAVRWRAQEAATILKDPQIWLIFFLSMLDPALNLIGPLPRPLPALIGICVVVFACVVISKLRVPLIAIATPSVILLAAGTLVMLNYHAPSLFVRLLFSDKTSPLALSIYALTCFGFLVQPLIWSIIPTALINNPSKPDRLSLSLPLLTQSVSVSFAGWALSRIVVVGGFSGQPWTVRRAWAYLAAAVAAVALWVALGVVVCVRRRARRDGKVEGEEEEEEERRGGGGGESE
ncbi:3-hydroxyisobutyrate dehydrogenase [Diplodia corticola]|uniref:3-hydroxyisobutyrate dehydrogenase n=1 Tax=Diplodia corticola TaxID=236234 RepID=A0A1J9S9J2_9PEZI|nr:3-hydroxyisobutyrate dehydrogenase [Diplodia corticola]OJD36253.1 3-hydroxyisobutyrate dehydrogenase [Diplodia corticola]